VYLPGFAIPDLVEAVVDLAPAVKDAQIVISAVPSQHVRETYRALARYLQPGQIFVSATKGIEDGTFLRMTQVMEQELGQACGSLSGPSFAQEVAAGAGRGAEECNRAGCRNGFRPGVGT
jgi:glycerol-3-phosphate dehydrogenase (NAD(P)+)